MPRYEMHFFDRERNFRRGRGWYLRRLSKRTTPQTRVIGEKTPTYSYDPKCAPRIARTFPDVKLVWVLRHPVSRAYSNYLHAYTHGYDMLSFEESVAAEHVRPDPWVQYMKRSCYAEQIERFARFYPREQQHFMLFEDWAHDADGEFAKLCAFLNVNSAQVTDERRGATRIPRSPSMVYCARQTFGRGPVFWATERINRLGVAPGYPKLSRERRDELFTDHFAEDTKRLAALTGLDLRCWNPD